MDFDSVSQKEDSIQYVPRESTLRAILNYEVVLADILQQNENSNGVYKLFRDGAACKINLFLNSTPNVLELCIYHDDFSIVNTLRKLGNFYETLGNFPPKFRSRLNDIHLILLPPALLVAKYGYRSLHSALIEVLKNLKIDGISVNFEGLLHYFNGTLSMVVAGNLAAHALGGFFHSTKILSFL